MMAETVPLRRVSKIVSGQSPPNDTVTDLVDGLPFVQGNAEFGPVSPNPKFQCMTAPKQCHVGDILLSVRAPVGAMNLADREYGIGRGLAAVRLSAPGDQRFLSYCISASMPTLLSLATGSTFESVTRDHVGAHRIPWLEAADQRRIADFLDDQVTRIDAIAEASKVQISLLDERVAEAILSAVRGDDLPDQGTGSGLRWLGNVPKSWPVLTVGSQFEVLLGKMLDEKRNAGTHSVPYLRNTNVQWDRVDEDDLKEMDIAPAERHRFLVRQGDLLICEGGQPGRAAIWAGRCEEIYYQKALHRARTRGRSLPRWLFYCLRAAVGMNAFAGENGQTTIGHLTSEQLRGQRLPFPTPDVQTKIVAALDAYQDEAKHLVAVLNARIKFLQERKRALITAAVTGEFDVSSTASGRNVA